MGYISNFVAVGAPDSDVVAVQEVAGGAVVVVALQQLKLKLVLFVAAPALPFALEGLVQPPVRRAHYGPVFPFEDEGSRQRLLRSGSLSGVLLETSLEEVSGELGEVRWVVGLLRLDVLDGLVDVLVGEGELAGEQLVGGDPYRPDVDELVVLPREHFGSLVAERARHRPHFHLVADPSIELRDFEVDEFDVVFQAVVEYVLWFDIAMADASLVHEADGLQQLLNDFTDFFVLEPSLAVQNLLQLGVGVIVQHQLAAALLLVHEQIMRLNYVRVDKKLQNLILGFQGADELAVAVSEQLDRKRLFRGALYATLDDGLGSLAQLLPNLVQIEEAAIYVHVPIPARVLEDRQVLALLALPNDGLFGWQPLRGGGLL